MIISLAGSRGVGKSTLFNKLKKSFSKFNYVGTRERQQYLEKLQIPQIKDEDSYYKVQKIYMGFIFQTLDSFNEGDFIIMDRGAEYSVFYTHYYPIIKGYDWDVNQNLNKEFHKLKEYKSDYILFLNASENILSKRRMKNKKFRSLKTGSKILNSTHMRNYFINLKRTVVLNTDGMSKKEVFNWTVEWLNKKRDI